MTRVRFRASGFEIDVTLEDNPLGYRWWRINVHRGWIHQSIYVVPVGSLSTGHHIVADELGALRICTPHEMFPVTNDCAEHSAAEYAAAAIKRHAVQPELF